MDHCLFPVIFRVPALPVKNLTGSGPVHPALAGTTPQDQIHFSVKNFISMTNYIYFVYSLILFKSL